jgi:HEAT repeat protein
LPNDAVAVAAAWGVARMGDKKAEPLLVKLLGSPAPEVRALGAIGLGLTRDKRDLPALAALARAPEAGAVARAAATHALGELGATGEAPLFASLADSPDPLLREAALFTMARLAARDDGPRAGAVPARAVADALAAAAFAVEPSLREAAVRAATALAARSYRRSTEALPVPDGPLALRDVLLGLGPDPLGPAERAAGLVALAPALERAAVAAVATSPERALVVADALLSREDLGLAPFTDGASAADPKLAEDERRAIEGIAAATVPAFVALVRHPAVDVRTRAVELCARRPEPEAQAAVVDALGDPEEPVRRAALSALGRVKSAPTIAAVARLVRESSSWPLRVRAAEALGRLGAGGAPPAAVTEALEAAARGDAYALVREAAARALAEVDARSAEPLLRELAAKDPEPRVRDAANELLKGR